jgi:TolB-like protein/Tfp pilus assembly protein PilF
VHGLSTHGTPWLKELGRRGVIHVAGLYVLASWVLVQVVDLASRPFPLPDEALRLIWLAAGLGFPIALIFGWRYDITRDGVVRTDPYRPDGPSRSLSSTDRAIIALLSAVGLGIVVHTTINIAGIVEQSRSASAEETVEASIARHSIAVLPFADMSPGQDHAYFSDGLAEELLNLLARIPELNVAARTSCFAFKGQSLEVTEIGRRLRVAHVLEGSVRRLRDRVRVTAQLIDAHDGYQLWSDIYDREIGDIFSIQNDIARQVVAELKVELLGDAPTVEQTDPVAYELFLQARHVAHHVTVDTYDQAIDLYTQALRIDPAYAAAWTGLARVYGSQVEKGLREDEEGRKLAFAAVERARALDPESPQVHAVHAWLAMYMNGDLTEAAAHFERAMELAPTDPEILFDSATLLQDLGRMDAAIRLKELSVARDPVNPRRSYNLGNAYLFGRRYDEAVDAYRTALTLSPTLLGARYHIGRALLLKGDYAAALVEIEAETFRPWQLVGLPAVLHALGRTEEADAALAELIEKYEEDAAYNIAYVCAFRGETDLAFDWLEKAVQYADPGLSEIAVTPEFASIEGDPRWRAFLERMGKSPEQLGAISFDVSVPADTVDTAVAGRPDKPRGRPGSRSLDTNR